MKSIVTWRKNKAPAEFPHMGKKKETPASTGVVATKPVEHKSYYQPRLTSARDDYNKWMTDSNKRIDKISTAVMDTPACKGGKLGDCFLCNNKLGTMAHLYHGERICETCHEILREEVPVKQSVVVETPKGGWFR